MKVQIKQLSNGYFSFQCVKYRAGDILEVAPECFNSEVMVDITEPVVPIVVVEAPVVKATRKRKVAAPVESPIDTAD